MQGRRAKEIKYRERRGEWEREADRREVKFTS